MGVKARKYFSVSASSRVSVRLNLFSKSGGGNANESDVGSDGRFLSDGAGEDRTDATDGDPVDVRNGEVSDVLARNEEEEGSGSNSDRVETVVRVPFISSFTSFRFFDNKRRL